MRLGMNFGLKAKNPEEWAEEMSRYNVKAASLPVDYHADFHEIEAYMKAAKDHDIVIAEVGAWCNPLTKDPREASAAFEKCVEQLKLADYVGARCACNIAGSAGPVWDAYYPDNYSEDFYKKTVETIQKIIETAKPRNTFYAIEPMPWMVPSSPDEYLTLIRDVGSDRLAVHLDIINWMNSFERYRFQRRFMDEVFEKLHGRIVSCHFKDCILKNDLTFQIEETPVGEGAFDIDYYVDKVNEENPDLPLIIEHLSGKRAYIKSMRYINDRYASIR